MVILWSVIFFESNHTNKSQISCFSTALSTLSCRLNLNVFKGRITIQSVARLHIVLKKQLQLLHTLFRAATIKTTSYRIRSHEQVVYN